LKERNERDFRFIYHQNGEQELYDYRNDPGEMNNVCLDPIYTDIKQYLLGQLLSFTMNYGKKSGSTLDRQDMLREQDSLVTLLHKKGYCYSQLADKIQRTNPPPVPHRVKV
jgi:hypothetical protein